MTAIWDTVSNLESYGPYVICFLISALVCWFDIHKVSEDAVIYSTNPLFSRESWWFIVTNGVAAAVLYGFASHSKIGIAAALTWNQEDIWVRAFTVGISSIVVIRSRILPLKENKALGLDVIYTRWRDRGVHAVCNDTIAKRRAIVREFRQKFLNDPAFIEEFSEIVMNMLTQNRQTEAVRAEKTQVENMRSVTDSPENNLEIVHGSLIRSAVTYGNLHYVERILRRKEKYNTFAPRGWLRW